MNSGWIPNPSHYNNTHLTEWKFGSELKSDFLSLYLYHKRQRAYWRNCKLQKLVKVSVLYNSITVAIILCVCCSHEAVATSHSKPYPSTDWLHYNNNTNTQQNETLFQNESQILWHFSLLVSHRIIQRQRMQKYAVTDLWVADDIVVMWHSSPLHLKFLSGSLHLCIAMLFISEFIWFNLRLNGLTWQAKFIILYFAINLHWNSMCLACCMHVIATQPVNQSAFSKAPTYANNFKHTHKEANLRLDSWLVVIIIVYKWTVESESFLKL